MKYKLSLLFLFVFFLTVNSQAQEKNHYQPKLSHSIKIGNENKVYAPKQISFQADTVKVVAIMVQFQEDNTPFSTGNGKFDLSNKYFNPSTQRDTVIDSPPYDSSYFTDHLEFLKNYFNKSSKGKLVINYDLYGKVITLPNVMQQYSPQKNESNLKLGEFFKDAWASADSTINFSSYNPQKTAFVIFHAGAGRDIDLTSIFGYDPTPYDIPSVFIGLKSLQEIYGTGYNGFVTADGFTIQNSMIIPSTELRDLNLLSGNTLIELGINGILAGNFGSYLGLPDLYNTVTGKTAIGRFGLMDGQSIFSYNGIFPPEPSAWEKYYLGWINPVTVSSGNISIKINTSSVPYPADTTMLKVLISSKEYFLIENRSRNPFRTGQKVYTRNRAFLDSAVYTKDVPGFLSYEIYSIDGNLRDVSYFDWSLPGVINDTSNFSGGILIWHIDENVIESKLASNTVNNDINHKGIDLEEAKGSQDIGVTFNTPFGAVTGDGYFVDFWYNGNHYVPSTIYKNEFTPVSIPNSLSYSRANNNIYITDFDTISSVMKLRVKIGNSNISPLTGFPKYIGGNNNVFSQIIPIDINGDGRDELFVNNGQDIYAFKNDGTGFDANPNGLFITGYGGFPVSYAYSPAGGNKKLIVFNNFASNSKTGLFGLNNFSITDSTIDNYPFLISTTPIVFDSLQFVLGFSNGFVYERRLSNTGSGYRDSLQKGGINRFSKENAGIYRYSYGTVTNILIGNITSQNSIDSLTLTSPKTLSINGKSLDLKYEINSINSPILADINKDGRQEIIFSDNDKVYALNSQGILLDNFPLKLKSPVISGFSVADVNGDNIYDILFVTTDGDLYVYGLNGKNVDGFPVKVGPNTKSTPAIVNFSDTLGIAVLSGDNYLYAFKTGTPYNPSKVLWKNYLKDKNFSNNNYISVNSPVVYSDKLPQDKVYNWPNPVYEDKTFIRYYLNGNGTSVDIKILDLSGELVTKLAGTANSNSENEIVWQVGNVQSGIYYGVIDAVIDGNKETRIIKIAVVK